MSARGEVVVVPVGPNRLHVTALSRSDTRPQRLTGLTPTTSLRVGG